MDKVQKRVIFLDILRGAALVNMIFYHALYDLKYMFSKDLSWFGNQESYIWQQYICMSFILIAGISCGFSKHQVKNGVKLLICAAGLSAVTFLVLPEEAVKFGVLHFLGVAILITALLATYFRRFPPIAGLICMLLLFIVCKSVPNGILGIPGAAEVHLPAGLYESPFLFWLGFPNASFWSADYFPLIPWIFLFLAGYYGGLCWIRERNKLLEREEKIANTSWYRILNGSLGKIGQASLIIYLVHQPVLYGCMILLDNLKIL